MMFLNIYNIFFSKHLKISKNFLSNLRNFPKNYKIIIRKFIDKTLYTPPISHLILYNYFAYNKILKKIENLF